MQTTNMLEVSFQTFPELRTKRCVLRQPSTADAPGLYFLRSNEEVMKYVDREKMQSVEEAQGMLEKIQQSYEAGQGISWIVTLPEEGKMRGLAGIWRIDHEHHRGEIGYTINPELWNQGIASEIMAAVVEYGFEKMNLHSLEANVNPSNGASIRVLQKLGFVQEAYFRENYYFRGQFLDSMIFCRLNESHKKTIRY
jgi:ribosomal-protein-alanine N-acetyltransferase